MFAWTNAHAQYCHEGIPGGCQCVAFAYDNGYSDFFGTGYAKNWYGAANGKGYSTGHVPMVGAVIVFDSWGKSAAGHVAIIASIASSSEIAVNHANWAPNGATDDRIYRSVSVKDLSGGNWTSVSVYGSGSYPVLGFIYSKDANLGFPATECSQVSATQYICWLTKNGVDRSCENATAWGIEDSVAHMSQPADWSICSTSCYDSQSSALDFLISPVYATGTISSCAKQVISTDHLETSIPPPITGGKHPGDLPNLIVHELYLVKEADRDSPHLSQIHIGERSYCNIQVKNTGEAGAWGTWANRCYLSKGNYRDHDPDNLGHESMTDLSAGQSRRVYQIIPAFEYPGKFNITACADTDGNDGDKKIAESDEGDNCHDEYRFDVVSDPNLATMAISLTGIVGNPVINQPFNISSTTTNLGENFGPDYVYIGYFVDGELVGQNQIRRENMKGGMSKAEEIPIHGGIATAGVHEIKACADFTDDIVETNESDNCRILLVNVTAPVSPILSINGVVLANGTRHVFTDERPDISISIGNTGGISSPMTGEVFISSAPHGVENISLGTFQVGAVPEGGNATGTLSGVSFTKLGPWVLTACIEGMTTCTSGDVVTIESSHPVNKHVNPAVLMILNKHRRERSRR
ncbi:MAG: CHAP domain-containing protein [Candidatus Moraniibacteriota bacterium]|nr:MAG: CHAP domain-containing protein [Candidatus Moranbacteria bacterium]